MLGNDGLRFVFPFDVFDLGSVILRGAMEIMLERLSPESVGDYKCSLEKHCNPLLHVRIGVKRTETRRSADLIYQIR